ncbi:MAG TPA: branched-chain amino acid ABC transporter permease [Myxococcaceae bacterium]|nr:branched-chain amino acid ABC transporter permease [Myxococcaceae bacterium]
MSTWRQFIPEWLSPAVLAVFVAAAAVLHALPYVVALSPYDHNQLTLAFLFIATALAWNWIGGFAGQISFGHAAMFGVGGFAAARALQMQVAPFWVPWLLGGLVAGAYGLAWGHPTLRLRGPYFSIATIGVGEATRLVLTYWQGFTGGASGLALPINAQLKYSLYWYALYFLALVAIASYAIRNSRLGLGLLSIKSDVEAAADVGVPVVFCQDLVLFLSGAVVGVAGGIYASYFSFIEPSDMFGFDRSISFVLMAVIGGVGTVFGPGLGAVVFVLLRQFLIASYPQLYLGLYGLLLVLVVLFEPLGISGLIFRVARRLRPHRGAT